MKEAFCSSLNTINSIFKEKVRYLEVVDMTHPVIRQRLQREGACARKCRARAKHPDAVNFLENFS